MNEEGQVVRVKEFIEKQVLSGLVFHIHKPFIVAQWNTLRPSSIECHRVAGHVSVAHQKGIA